jgi:hypothetical protein
MRVLRLCSLRDRLNHHKPSFRQIADVVLKLGPRRSSHEKVKAKRIALSSAQGTG